VAPTIINNVKPGDAIMQEEIFGPVLPVIDFENFEEVYGIIEQIKNLFLPIFFTEQEAYS